MSPWMDSRINAEAPRRQDAKQRYVARRRVGGLLSAMQTRRSMGSNPTPMQRA